MVNKNHLATMAFAIAMLSVLLIAADSPVARRLANLSEIRVAGDKIKPLHVPKREARPNDWLASHPEAGQTFDQYRATNPNRPTARLTTIYVQPLGTFTDAQQKVLDRAKTLLTTFYGLPVKSLEPIQLKAIPATARRIHPSMGNEQILTTYVLNELLPPRRPADAVAVLALTTSDLWPGDGWNFVFGQGTLRERVGVHSLARYGDPGLGDAEYQLCLRRTLKVACHETGHMLGIPHCTAGECGMNGANSIDELDRNQLAFCAECEQKAWWACRLNPGRRYSSLNQFARDNRLHDEERTWTESLQILTDK